MCPNHLSSLPPPLPFLPLVPHPSPLDSPPTYPPCLPSLPLCHPSVTTRSFSILPSPSVSYPPCVPHPSLTTCSFYTLPSLSAPSLIFLLHRTLLYYSFTTNLIHPAFPTHPFNSYPLPFLPAPFPPFLQYLAHLRSIFSYSH